MLTKETIWHIGYRELFCDIVMKEWKNKNKKDVKDIDVK